MLVHSSGFSNAGERCISPGAVPVIHRAWCTPGSGPLRAALALTLSFVSQSAKNREKEMRKEYHHLLNSVPIVRENKAKTRTARRENK